MTLGQALLFGLENDNMRTANLLGKSPKVHASKRGEILYLNIVMS